MLFKSTQLPIISCDILQQKKVELETTQSVFTLPFAVILLVLGYNYETVRISLFNFSDIRLGPLSL